MSALACLLASVLALSGGAVKPGETKRDTWWLPLAGVRLEPGHPELFDPWFIYIQTPGLHKPQQVGDAGDKHWTEGGNKKATYKALVEGNHLEPDETKRQRIVDALAQRHKGKLAAYKEVWPAREGEDTIRQG